MPLSFSASVIGIKALHNEGSQFYEDPDLRQARKLRAEQQKLVPEECWDEVFGKNADKGRMSLTMRRGSKETLRSFEKDDFSYSQMYWAYSYLRDTLYVGCPKDPQPTPTPRPTEPNFPISGGRPDAATVPTVSVPGFGLDIDITTVPTVPSGPPPAWCDKTKTITANLNAMLADPDARKLVGSLFFGFLSDSDYKLLSIYHHALHAGSGDAALAYLFSVKDTMTIDERLVIVQAFGKRFHTDYDEERNKKRVRAKGVLTLDQLLAAGATNNEQGFDDRQIDAAYDDTVYAGVCRDIASGQGQMLVALGFKSVYTVSYVRSDKNWHTTVVAQDPNQSRLLHKLNYEDRRDSSGVEGGLALFQGEGDVTVNYFISKPGGRSVKSVPSEFGKFMAEVAGFDIHNLDAMMQQHGKLYTVDVMAKGGVKVRPFYGSDGTGAKYYGVAADKTFGDGTLHPGKVGVAVAHQLRPQEYFGTLSDASLDTVYAHYQQELNSRDYKIKSAKLSARIEQMATVIFSGVRMTGGEDAGDYDGGGDLHVRTGVRVNQGLEPNGAWRDRFMSTYYVGADVGPGIKDVRNVNWKQMPIPVLNNLIFTAEGRLRLSKTAEGRAFLMASMTVLKDEFGSRAKAEVGLIRGDAGASASFQGRINDDMPAYDEGTIRRAKVDLTYKPKSWLSLDVDAYQNFDRDALIPDKEPARGVMGTVTIRGL